MRFQYNLSRMATPARPAVKYCASIPPVAGSTYAYAGIAVRTNATATTVIEPVCRCERRRLLAGLSGDPARGARTKSGARRTLTPDAVGDIEAPQTLRYCTTDLPAGIGFASAAAS